MREDRRVVPALSADLVASTALGERLDPEDYRAIIMVAAVEELGGTVEALAGDGLLALFGAPVAHEDDPERAFLIRLEHRPWACLLRDPSRPGGGHLTSSRSALAPAYPRVFTAAELSPPLAA